MWHLATWLMILLIIKCLEFSDHPRTIQTQEHSRWAVPLHEHTYTVHQEPQPRHAPRVLNKSQWKKHLHSANVPVSTRQGSTNTSQKPWVQDKKKKKSYFTPVILPVVLSKTTLLSLRDVTVGGKKSAYCSTLLLARSGNSQFLVVKGTVDEVLVSGVTVRISQKPSGIN